MNNEEKEELKALIEHEKKNLLFYAIAYGHLLEKGITTMELERRIDIHLDRLLFLLSKLNK